MEIKVTYECDETNQKMVIKISEKEEQKVDVYFDFFPPVDENTQDPYGFMNRIINMIKSS